MAAELLHNESIFVTIVNVSTLKPIDENLILEETKKHNAVVTAEDHNIIGGLCESICRILTNHKIAVPFKSIAVRDQFAETGSGSELYEKYGLSAKHIARTVKEVLANREA